MKCFVFFVECKLHQTNCEYSLFSSLIVPRSCLRHKRNPYSFIQLIWLCIITFSHITPLQSPTGGTSGLCLKKLNITTSSYRIIINRLDRKVNLSTQFTAKSSTCLTQITWLFCACLSICLQVTVNYRPARLPLSRHSLYVEDTGSMYLIQTPGGVSIQWYHSTGIMVLQYITTYNASVPTRGLCGESTHTQL